MNSTIKTAEKVVEELNQSNKKSGGGKEGMQHTKARLGGSLNYKWESKVMHGQYIGHTDSQLISNEGMFLLLSVKRGPEAETGSEMIAAHDQALQTKYYATKILQTETDSKCRLCQQFDKTIYHIISGCPIFTKEQYVKRHDRVCAQLHFNICKEMGVKLDSEHWYEHVPKSVPTSHEGKVRILWNQKGAN